MRMVQGLRRRGFSCRRLALTASFLPGLAIPLVGHVVVDQRGVDVMASLDAPDRTRIADVDSPDFSFGPELLSALAASTGEYWLSIPQETVPPDASAAPILELGRTVEHETVAGRTDRFSIPLAADQSLDLAIEPLAGDLFVTVRAPGDEVVRETDSPFRPDSPGELSIVSIIAGTYRLEIRPADASVPAFRYRLRAGFPRRATASDRTIDQAERTFATAIAARERGDSASSQAAFRGFEEALRLFETAGEPARQAETLLLLGSLEESAGNLRKAVERFRRALECYQHTGDRVLAAIALSSIGGAEARLGEVSPALADLEEALQLHREFGNQVEEAIALNNIANIFTELGEAQHALELYDRSLALRITLGDRRGEAVTLHNMGFLYADFGDKRKALDYYQRALPIRRETGDRRGEAYTLACMGIAYDSLGEYRNATELLVEALALFRSVGDRLGEARTMGCLGRTHESSGAKTEALEEYEKAIDLSRATGDQDGEASGLARLGTIRAALGQTDRAITALDRALELNRRLGYRVAEAGNLYQLARIASAREDLPEARRLIENNMSIVESLRANLASRELRASFLGALQDYYSLSVQILMQMHRREPGRGYDALALEASERGRARSLIELLVEGGADIRQGVDPELHQREISLGRLLAAKVERRRRVLTGKPSPEQAAEIEKEVSELSLQYDKLDAEIRTKNPAYAALTRPQPLTVSRIQKLLDEETLLLEYSIGEEQSFVWGITASSIEVAELPGRFELEALARNAHEELSEHRGSRGGHKRGVARLSSRVLTPVARWLSRKRLLIAADGALQLVPFGALLEPGKNTPLIESHEIVNIPSASALEALRRQVRDRPSAAQILAVIADPVFDRSDERVRRVSPSSPGSAPRILSKGAARENSLTRSIRDFGEGEAGLPRLPFTRREAKAIERLVSVSERKVALDFEANRAAAISEELSQYRYVHFATHGLLDTVHPELSGLVLSLVDRDGRDQDGFLSAMEVFNLRLFADLVVLSACRTALGKEIRGEGLIGLTRAFMYAGAPRVVASLWRVDDAATAELMKRFYEGMLGPRRLRPVAALRKAQLAVCQQKRWKHPYYWAGFVLQGEWR